MAGSQTAVLWQQALLRKMCCELRDAPLTEMSRPHPYHSGKHTGLYLRRYVDMITVARAVVYFNLHSIPTMRQQFDFSISKTSESYILFLLNIPVIKTYFNLIASQKPIFASYSVSDYTGDSHGWTVTQRTLSNVVPPLFSRYAVRSPKNYYFSLLAFLYCIT